MVEATDLVTRGIDGDARKKECALCPNHCVCVGVGLKRTIECTAKS